MPNRPFARALPFALLLAAAGPALAQESACGCADVADLRNRICEARAAIEEYGRQIGMIRAQERKTGQPVLYTVPRYVEHVQPCVQEAINQVTDPNARHPTATTNNACQVSYAGSPSPCLQQVLGRHEAVHVTVCQKWTNDRNDEGFFAALRGTFSDFREGTTLVDLLNEERAAYQVEINHVRDELARMARNRPPCPGMPVEPPGPPRIPSPEQCPPPKPRPAPQDSSCKHR